jgi:predicted nucleic acid-binding protein
MHLIDASVWVATADPRDRFHTAASAIVADVDEPLAALDLTLYEVANVMGLKKKQPDRARLLLQMIAARCEGALLAADVGLLEAAVELTAQHDLTAYDAAYVAAARRHGWILVSTDIADLVSKGLAVAPDAADYP